MRISVILALLLVTFVVAAQRQKTEYNRKGDDAMNRLDFSAAKLWYEEGVVSNCDTYSINQLTAIWRADESMRASMRSVMSKCLDCLDHLATQNKDSASISLLIDYYQEGIGTHVNEAKAEIWHSQLDVIRNPIQDYSGHGSGKPTREKVKMDLFVGYSGSLVAPFGLTVGGVGRTIGWYARFRTNMSFQGYTETCDSDGNVIGLNDSYPSPLNDSGKSNTMIGSGGLIIKASPSFHISAGAGYWVYDRVFEFEKIDITDASKKGLFWAKSEDFSKKGIVVDLDGTLRVGKNFYFSLGGSVLGFEYVSANAGLGVFF